MHRPLPPLVAKAGLALAGVVAAAAVGAFVADRVRRRAPEPPGAETLATARSRDAVLQARAGLDDPELEGLTPAQREVLLRMRRRDELNPPVPVRAFPDSTLAREVVRRDTVLALAGDLKGAVFDEHAFYRHAPGRNDRFPFPEYPGGEILLRTNSSGYREDAEVRTDEPELRVVVVGDSHTDGLCANAESFPNLLEAALRERGRDAEALNAGRGGYSFYNYLGALERDLALDPDVFVVAVFAGNDFSESLTWRHYFERTVAAIPEVGYDFAPLLERGYWSHLAQGLSQAAQLAHNPPELELARRTALEVSDEIVRVCRAHGVAPVFALIPAPCDVEWERHAEAFAEVAEALHLPRERAGVGAELSRALAEHLRAQGVAVVDGHALLAEGGPYYWRADLHLDLAGHARFAEALVDVVEAAVAGTGDAR